MLSSSIIIAIVVVIGHVHLSTSVKIEAVRETPAGNLRRS